MKTTAVAVTALLASIAFAQPYHGRHFHKDLHKRKLVVVTTTCTETATLIIDQDGTSLIEPTPAQFYPSTTSDETTSTTSTSTSTSSTSTPMSKPTTLSTSTSTSAYVQPQPTTPTTQAQETTPTPTTEAPAYTQTTSEAAAPTYGSGGSSSGGGSSYSGDITFYDLGMGSCGIQLGGMSPGASSESDAAVVALSHFDMNNPANPNLNPLCGKLIKITANGKTGYGKVLDTCMGCEHGSIDVNQDAFSFFYPPSAGRAAVSWEWA